MKFPEFFLNSSVEIGFVIGVGFSCFTYAFITVVDIIRNLISTLIDRKRNSPPRGEDK